ncbi:MAG: glycosyltransferase, partial [Trichloromonadaceae bacterium]
MSCLRVLIDDDMINIIISVYNGERFIEEQINSILRQKCNNFKTFIRDDGSADNTVRIIKKISKQSPSKVIVI